MEGNVTKNQHTPVYIYFTMCLEGCLTRRSNTMKLFKYTLLTPLILSEIGPGRFFISKIFIRK